MLYERVNWIDINQQLPDLDEYVLATDGEHIIMLQYDSNKYAKNPKPRFTYQNRVNFPWEITHWMRLPKPPKY